MNLSQVLERVADSKSVERALAVALAGPRGATIELRDAFKPAFLAGLAKRLSRPLILVVADEGRSREMARDIETWLSGRRVLTFSDPDQPAYSQMSINQTILSQRAAVMAELIRHDSTALPSAAPPPIVVSSIAALMRRLTPVDEFRRQFLTVAPGQALRPEDLIQRLVTLGYKRNPLVEAAGEFAHRGGIVDVFPPQTDRPIRLDFFGDEIESVRYFDPETQRSLEPCPDLFLSSASEVPIWLGPQIAGSLRELDLAQLRPEDRLTWLRHLDSLEGGQYFDNAAFYTMSALARASTLRDYCPSALLAVDEPEAVAFAAAEYAVQSEETRKRLLRSGELPEGFGNPLFSVEEMQALVEGADIGLTYKPRPSTGEERRQIVGGFEGPASYSGRLQRLIADLGDAKAAGLRSLLVSYQGRRLGQLLNEQGLGAAMLEDIEGDLSAGAVAVVRGTLSEGWKHVESGFQVLSDAEIFGRSRIHGVKRFKKAADRTFLSDLQPGDFVVHVEYGIGRFEGIVRLTEVGGEREYLLLGYAKGDRLYVPVDQLGRVQRFIGMGDYKPKLSSLGTNEWNRAKEKAGKSAREIAGELIEIYAARELAEGRSFGPDTVWQRELEDSFQYVETEDQGRAILDVKADMEKPRPMDRLVCGDVGFGKTEVAIRAAFKAATDGVQVAVLVPTTILAQQHFDTFTNRMGEYPLRIEMLSRFRSPDEQRKVVEELAGGAVDIVIGTHRIIQNDIKFKNLGLVIVDEEQRFGVAAKERLKRLRKEVDVLTLTATPIPRTLHMALVGVRDVSIMETPPPDRLAVKTYVAGYENEMVRRAILNEVGRGGQVYYVHNRVKTIEAAAQRLRELVPEARFVIAHGQMPSSALESVMVAFASGDYDVLLCSSIIENGMDLPNVNTLIVDECWMFGLAQLYQLRGRVGRAANQAYAYFLYGSRHRMTEDAQKRLQAILEASELGAGFRLAMRDLEIRGAGDLLGANQHGFANAVGFDLYCRMITDAVDAMRGQPPVGAPGLAATVDLPIDAYLPDEYMGGYETKIREYQRLAQLSTRTEVEEALSGLRDRFGEFPGPVVNLAYVITLRARAAELGLSAITSYGGDLLVRLPKDFSFDREIVHHTVGGTMRVGKVGLTWPEFERDPEWRRKLMALLDALIAASGRAVVEAGV